MRRYLRTGAAILIVAGAAFWAAAGLAGEGDAGKEAAYRTVAAYVSSAKPCRMVLAPEGEFVAVFNERVAPWVEARLTAPLIEEIRAALKPSLRIELNARGFASAASRAVTGGKDETHYDAIWVRDNVWIYHSFLTDPGRRDDARRLLLALWDYYATDAQRKRFKAVIADPSLAADQMAMPHIRFDGSSPDLGDVMIDGKPEVWNHRQIDAHGLFFAALGRAVEDGLIGAGDLTHGRAEAVTLYPPFLKAIRFYDYEDAGAWEEIPRKNTSSIGLATRSLEVWRGLILSRQSSSAGAAAFRAAFGTFLADATTETRAVWSEAAFTDLIQRGLATVKYQLYLGGESPDYPPDDIHFRLADAALAVLIVPVPLEGLTEEDLRKGLAIAESLQRPRGLLRYRNDSYQSGNYWITDPSHKDAATPSLTGDTSSTNAFLERLSRLIPDTEAEWFFDSIFAAARLRLAAMTRDGRLREQDLHFAALHLKRALGQITGGGITADGKPVGELLTPESINTVVIDSHRYYLPSPIVPLNWAKAALAMALAEYEKHVQPAAAGEGR